MSQQGWTPGQYLGAQNAPHAEFHTEANASHIRVVLKDDNLGIGAKKGSGVAQGDCVGLDVFQTLLGRLNADDEDEYVAEQKRREDLRTAIYSEKKWGTIRFVSGGFLIGDKIQDLIDGEKERLKDLKAAKDAEISSDDNSDSDSDSDSDDEEEKVVKKPKKVNKVTEIEIETEKLSIDKSRSKKRKAEDDDEDKAAKRKAKDEEKEQKKAEKKAAKKLETAARKQSDKEDESTMTKEERKQKKKEKKERKEKKRAEKAAKKAAKALTKEKKKCSAVPTPPASGTSTPRPILQSGRLAVRARWIEQKRLAAMGGSATNEVSFYLLRAPD